ncbi:hypothetical protein EDD86DRAFT_249037 [Gorgonomyces haynaldii]|nr:hypothetical protein EDD86DRAFT_249037 [Gorgonomyces haynaldii]
MSAPQDCDYLLSFYASLRSPLTLSSSNCCNSKLGTKSIVTCAGGRITELLFGNIGATGFVPDALSSLTGLEVLNLDHNQLIGTIPASLGKLVSLNKSLDTLYLHDNAFTGTIPSSWGKMSKLTAVMLQNSGITGPMPSAWSDLVVAGDCDVGQGGLPRVAAGLFLIAGIYLMYVRNSKKAKKTQDPGAKEEVKEEGKEESKEEEEKDELPEKLIEVSIDLIKTIAESSKDKEIKKPGKSHNPHRK